jgi:hypothetical protein
VAQADRLNAAAPVAARPRKPRRETWPGARDDVDMIVLALLFDTAPGAAVHIC